MTRKNYLPEDIQRKIYKTRQTRGAEDDEVYQNRVSRNSTVLIFFQDYEKYRKLNISYDNGFIVLISPKDYFSNKANLYPELVLGENLLVLYETRNQWNDYPIPKKWVPAQSRESPLGGQYIARVPALTSHENGQRIFEGYTSTKTKGAGIRVYEYAGSNTLNECELQLRFLFWHCHDIDAFITSNENALQLKEQKKYDIALARKLKLANLQKLKKARMLNAVGHTICPLCLKEISSFSFAKKMSQSIGRHVPDSTVTEISLFHIRELRFGEFNHKTYNLGWGHHHCNVVVKDSGIENTLKWMQEVLNDNARLLKQ